MGFLFFSIYVNCTLINCKNEQWHAIGIIKIKMNHVNLKCKNCARKDICEFFRTLFFWPLTSRTMSYFDIYFFFPGDISLS